MDKKNMAIGVALLLAAFAVLFFAPRSAPPTKPGNAPAVPELSAPVATPAPASAPGAAVSTAPTAPAGPAATNGNFAAVNRDAAKGIVTTLANDFIEARLSDFGGAVREVAFKQYHAVQGQPEPYLFNHVHEHPILALTDFPGLGRETRYELVSKSATEVVYRTVLDGRVEVTRRYRLMAENEPGGDPYRLHHETTFRNLTDATVPLPRAGLSVGTAALLNSSDPGQYLNVASYDGSSSTYTDRGELEGGGIGSLFGSAKEPKTVVEKSGQVTWAAVKNQFFASIYTPEKPGIAVVTRRIELPHFPDSQNANIGLTGAARFELPALAANGTAKLSGTLFVGPMEYRRLATFAHNEDKVMQFDRYFFNRIFLSGYIAPFLNILLNAAHRWVGNWGVAVIIMTLILKTVSVPFTLAASRSAKRMAKLQPLMKAIKEKYKDNPKKQQEATLAVFKEHKVNPVGGCIPILITFPFFIGFFAMLQGTAELRFAPFLWAKDLAAPDTVGHLFGMQGLPINIMPLLMGATMFFQMRLTPQPSVDNAQMKMMKFMPFIFTLFCYNFSCALSLYSTINGLFTIGQQMVINRGKDDDPAPLTMPGAKPIKNVTPSKKKG